MQNYSNKYIKADLPSIFAEPTSLHLLVWNRLNDILHEKAMVYLSKIINDSNLTRDVLPLLRPLGQAPNNFYNQYNNESFGDLGLENQGYIFYPAQNPVHLRSSHCELWLQVSNNKEQHLWSILKDFTRQNEYCQTWRNVSDPISTPFPKPIKNSIYFHTKSDKEARILNSLNEFQLAQLFKTIWARASYVICEQLIQSNSLTTISPKKDKTLLRDLLEDILVSITNKDINFLNENETIDPSRISVSHMSCFALNSITKMGFGCKYKIEEYLGSDKYTWPSMFFASRDEYLNSFN